MRSKRDLWDLYSTFLKIGGFTLGGGYAMIPLIQREVVDRKKWVQENDMVDYLTLCQSVPGAIAINTATLVGYRVGGIPGALAATAGMITPSLISIILIASIFTQFQQWELIQRAFTGVRAAVVALLIIAVFRISRAAVKSAIQLMIAIVSVGGILLFKWSPIWMIAMGVLIGLIWTYRRASNDI